jgi:hypothetical protein
MGLQGSGEGTDEENVKRQRQDNEFCFSLSQGIYDGTIQGSQKSSPAFNKISIATGQSCSSSMLTIACSRCPYVIKNC